jgi:hypothetical protein
MFDNPMATVWPQPPPKRPPVAAVSLGAAGVLCAMVGLVWAGCAWPRDAVTTFSSPTRLRQIEVVVTPALAGDGSETRFFLHDAGYRLPHKWLLIAVVSGAGTWSVNWLGQDRVRIKLGPSWSEVRMREPSLMPPVVEVDVPQARPGGSAPWTPAKG